MSNILQFPIEHSDSIERSKAIVRGTLDGLVDSGDMTESESEEQRRNWDQIFESLRPIVKGTSCLLQIPCPAGVSQEEIQKLVETIKDEIFKHHHRINDELMGILMGEIARRDGVIAKIKRALITLS